LFRQIAHKLVEEELISGWFNQIRYIDWVGEHKDLRFVDDDIDSVIIVDDYPPDLSPYSHELPDLDDDELEKVFKKLRLIMPCSS
jgi:hypothetical protein